MDISTEWQQIAIYAVLAALALALIQRIPSIGGIVRFAFSVGLLALCLFVLFQQAPFEPSLGRIADSLGLKSQEVSGDQVRIRMSPDGHFWARARLNGVERRMLVDSGATITAISEDTAREAGVDPGTGLVPIVLQTANGMARARTGSVERLELGSITATDLNVAISPALGRMDVLGMNFLSDLASWRVEGRTLILVPKGASTSE